MEQEIKFPSLEIHNENIHIPYRQLPAFESKMVDIYCQDFNHRDQKVQFLNMRESKDILKSRLHCRKCLTGPYAACSQDVAILEELLQDKFNALKHTKLQGNIFQEFSDFYHSFQFDIDEHQINLKFDLILEEFQYNLNQCKIKVLEDYEKYQKVKKDFQQVLQKFNPTFDFSVQEEVLREYAKLGKVPQPKEQQKMNQSLDQYVEKFYRKNLPDSDLSRSLQDLKKSLSQQQELLVFHSNKLDQGLQQINEGIDQIMTTFNKILFKQSELANDYISKVLERISVDYDKLENVKTIQKIYSSIPNGLNYKDIKLKLNDEKNILFIFSTNAGLKFGAYVGSQLRKKDSFLFSLSKRQIYPINNTINSPMVLSQQLNDNSEFLQFGNQDLLITSTFKNCISNLGRGFALSEYNIENKEMHLANSISFDITTLEIFRIP